jgi:hypothetical protein
MITINFFTTVKTQLNVHSFSSRSSLLYLSVAVRGIFKFVSFTVGKFFGCVIQVLKVCNWTHFNNTDSLILQ